MADDFFGTLGKKISKATHSAASATSSLVESTKLNAQISGEHKTVENLYRQIGEAVAKKAEAGELQLGDEENAIVEEIRKHKDTILGIRKALASIKGQKICPSCGEQIPKEVAYCPKCGTETPVEEEPIEEIMAEAVEDTDEAEEAMSASFEEVKEDLGEAAEEVKEAAAETAEEAKETFAEVAEEAAETVSEAAEEVKETVNEAAEEITE